MITYRELLNKLKSLDEVDLDTTATIFLSESDEYFAVNKIEVTKEDDVLDADHLILVVKG